MSGFFNGFTENIAKIFSGRNLLWHFLAIVLTFVLVSSGFDWKYFEATRGTALQTFAWPAVELGSLVPIFGILIFYLLASLAKKRNLANTALAVGQAALLGFLVSEFYKFFTGRPGPPHHLADLMSIDTSHVFRFGLLRGGLFFGWPSSHTTVAFSMAAALIALYPKNNFVKWIAVVYALYIGLGVSMTIHWFSDFAAGLIIGSVVGKTVGKSFQPIIAKHADIEKS